VAGRQAGSLCWGVTHFVMCYFLRSILMLTLLIVCRSVPSGLSIPLFPNKILLTFWFHKSVLHVPPLSSFLMWSSYWEVRSSIRYKFPCPPWRRSVQPQVIFLLFYSSWCRIIQPPVLFLYVIHRDADFSSFGFYSSWCIFLQPPFLCLYCLMFIT
jgi:hypothetical protein